MLSNQKSRTRTLLAAGLFAVASTEILPLVAALASDEPPLDIPSETVLQFSVDPYADQDKIGMIKDGLAHLAAIRYEPDSFSSANSGYTKVYGDFCVYDATLNKVDEPSLYPTIEDMMLTSDHCGDYTFALPLDEVIAAVSSHDRNVRQENIQVAVGGLMFHLGHAGAGILSNVLATFERALVVPEHPAIREALFACDYIHSKFESVDCSALLQKQLVEDVMALATRTSDERITHIYVKFHAESAAYLSMVREIFPDVPWTFHSRDSDTVLSKSTQQSLTSCVLTRRQPSFLLAQKSNEYNIDLDGMSQEDLCALYLSTLLDAATQEFEHSETGMLIPYDQLVEVDFITSVVLPHFGLQDEIDIDAAAVTTAVQESLSKKSNTRGVPGKKILKWNADEEVVDVSDKVSAANKLFMGHATTLFEGF